jgi:hypothetical protein
MPPLDLIDLLHQDGVENPSGLGIMHGVALLGYFITLNKPDDFTTMNATTTTISTIATPHVFATGKCMKKIYGTENKGDVKEDVVGDPDSQNVKNTVTLMVPGLTADYHTQRRLLNAALGILFVTQADGKVMQYGSAAFPCHFKVAWASGNNEGYRGYTITATCYGASALYTGGLNFTPAA